ncbi:hypothetical protein [Planococcus beigongshangi]|uniref:DUF7878 domain-containing protein n=1 Tax=Planococcus beigongshangi TaxID=2782536 RepID=UPI00193B4AFF|nr:hypothetical protein [Planococcus beigongshangi]
MKTLNIDFNLDPFLTLDPKLLKQKNGKLLIDVDGELTITLGESRFFGEPSLTLLELGVALKRWRIEDPNAIKDFHFFTMEHDEKEGPILAFRRQGKSGWQLFSIWQAFSHDGLISAEDLLEAVDRYLATLEEVLIKRYGLRYQDFMKRQWL